MVSAEICRLGLQDIASSCQSHALVVYKTWSHEFSPVKEGVTFLIILYYILLDGTKAALLGYQGPFGPLTLQARYFVLGLKQGAKTAILVEETDLTQRNYSNDTHKYKTIIVKRILKGRRRLL